MSKSTPELSHERRTYLLEAWKTSEDVAMHFNNLLLGFRLKAIGGIAVGAVAGFGLKLGDFAHPHVVGTVFMALAIIWVLVWAADFFYYYRLLAGAVDELLRLEGVLGDVHLSHLIERRVQGEDRPKRDINLLSYIPRNPSRHPSWPIWVFYAVPFLVLVAMAIAMWCTANRC
jgi:hypothetical protein